LLGPEVRLRILPCDIWPRRAQTAWTAPPERLGQRSNIAGHLVNNPDTLVASIRHPHRFNQVTAVPERGVGEQEARDIAAYLYTPQ
jgi:cytochrome c1